MLVRTIEMSDGFIGVVSMIVSSCCLLLEPEEKQRKAILRTAADFSANLQKLKTCLEISASFCFWSNLDSSHQVSCSQQPQRTNHPLVNALGPLEDQL